MHIDFTIAAWVGPFLIGVIVGAVASITGAIIYIGMEVSKHSWF